MDLRGQNMVWLSPKMFSTSSAGWCHIVSSSKRWRESLYHEGISILPKIKLICITKSFFIMLVFASLHIPRVEKKWLYFLQLLKK